MTARSPRAQVAGKRKPKARSHGVAAAKEAGMNDEIRAEIVTRLAMFDSSNAIYDDLQARGIDISVQGINRYKPGTAGQLALKWVELFNKTREDFLAEIAAEPIANRAFRLRKLGTILDKELSRGNTAGARATLEQAAKEVGNVFTNIAKVQGTKLPGQVDPADFSTQERRNMLSDRIGEALGKLGAQKQPTVQ